MNASLDIADSRLRNWLRLWQCPWLTMDASWFDDLQGGIDARLADAWRVIPPAALRRRLRLGAEAPEKPSEALLRWQTLSPQMRMEVLHLAAEVVVTDITAEALGAEDRRWCRHLARALMPGRWSMALQYIEAADLVGLAMFRQWLSPASWARVRLHHRRELVEEVEALALEALPASRLDQLWHGVIWRRQSGQANAAVGA